ncbi:hypothetical protein AKJ09_07709 [Labilithrix luteola]|uniref:Uncharacterized protein n=1 Tax=Labilithrix luteola TaxID=1391654 RepID=A0A0K1Q5E0_9BACT|nr:hypothetical protein [Labilithrix luteola]AKV01046.1 hypothetical protein AKJ09_07709 [Labilithrix luteola]
MKSALSALALSLVLLAPGAAAADDRAPAPAAPAAPSGPIKPATPAPATLDEFSPYPPRTPRILAQPDTGYSSADPRPYPSLPWLAAQLLPSPEVAFGTIRSVDVYGHTSKDLQASFGLRWQLTPLLWSWGQHRSLNRWHFLVIDPLARNSGSISADLNLEYMWGQVNRMLVRPGVHATFPILQRGEYLSTSIGTSFYAYDDILRVAYDVGAYCLFGLFGVQFTYAPVHEPLKTMLTFRIRYF